MFASTTSFECQATWELIYNNQFSQALLEEPLEWHGMGEWMSRSPFMQRDISCLRSWLSHSWLGTVCGWCEAPFKATRKSAGSLWVGKDGLDWMMLQRCKRSSGQLFCKRIWAMRGDRKWRVMCGGRGQVSLHSGSLMEEVSAHFYQTCKRRNLTCESTRKILNLWIFPQLGPQQQGSLH